ncbi:hypothetical protein SDRG_07989 [Saprolegnia diclina VS20]|uniref:FYVE-type domain-containing protein n=1 Tax=Saprolegnia diclina (strain VS20) TaxID=1156394 RepID=T0QLI7_SAPDV|nr:hypothetical protein SDRG_07989 [Saprolegnia diclina VS20]EQC34670.1 hypothetical protein SDRG_07989 [Saprolegnia diclina VS20]|eukprot:XP_008612076.1 hypothetical protein SDRG_07989 [Saprolegnia diclina VS20]
MQPIAVAGQGDSVPVCNTCFHYHEKLFGKFIEGSKPDRVGRKWPTNKYFARPEDLVRRDKNAPRDKCTLCARSFSVFRHRHTCATCGLVHCSQCTVSGLALYPGAATSVAIPICDTCSCISIIEKSYANCKTLRAELHTLVAAPDFPANTLGLDRDGALFRALSMATNGTLAEHTFAAPDKIVPLRKRSACSHCGSRVSYYMRNHNCVSCGEVFCFLCVLTKVAGTTTPLGPLHAVPQCFTCHAGQCFGENPWLPRIQ